MVWVVQLEEVVDGTVVSRTEVATLDRPRCLESLEDLGLRLADAKPMLASIQREIVTQQIKQDAARQSSCPDCGEGRQVKDYRVRRFDTLFGRIEVRVPRFVCPTPGCAGACAQSASAAALKGRSTPEYAATRAKLAAQLPYRQAAQLLADLLPVSGGAAHTTIRNQMFAVAEKITAQACERAAVGRAEKTQKALTLQLDHTYIRAAANEGGRHLQVLAGEVEPDGGGPRRRFASLADSSECPRIVREHLEQSGATQQTELTALTDGDEGLRNLARAAASGRPLRIILDWFHLAMRLRPVEQIAQGLRTRVPTHVAAKTKISDALEHLHWRLWHGKLDALGECYEQVREAISAFRRHAKGKPMSTGPRALMTGLHELKRYIANNAGTLINYHRRQQAGLRVSSCGAESTANCLINHRMNKSQQMRWSRRGADLLLQVRAAVLNGEFDALVRPGSVSHAANEDQHDLLPLAA
jgi:hypothetical protein